MAEIIEYVKEQANTIQEIRDELIDYRNQNMATQVKKGEDLIMNQVVYNKAFKMMGDEIFDLGMENETLREQIGDVDEKWLAEKKEINKVKYDDFTKNQYILNKMKRQYQKQLKQLT